MTRVIDDAAAHRAELPAELPRKAAATPIGTFLAWCVERGLASAWHEAVHPAAFQSLRERQLTGRDYLLQFLDGRLTDEHLGPAGRRFAEAYYLTRAYVADYEEALCGGLPSRYDAPDGWESVDALAPVLDARFEVWRAHLPEPEPGPASPPEPAPEPAPEPVDEPAWAPPPVAVSAVEAAPASRQVEEDEADDGEAGEDAADEDAAGDGEADDDEADEDGADEEGAYEPVDPAAFAAWATAVPDDRRAWLPTEPGRPPRHAPHARRRRAWRRPVRRARWGAILLFALLWGCAQCASRAHPARERSYAPVMVPSAPRPLSPRRTR